MPWGKLKSIFIVQDPDAAADLEAFQVPSGEAGALPATADASLLGGKIDFQGLYDQSGIPNTDEVESLEKFLGGLETSLPQTSKMAAAKAFLNAIGKAPNDVLVDSARKIGVVRAVAEAKRADTEAAVGRQQKAIEDLQREIDQHRSAVEAMQRELESVRSQCTIEEARLQGARVFFGVVGEVPPPAQRR